MSKTVAAGFIIFRRMDRNPIEYLLLQTSYGKHHWTPPKGHLDGDEKPLQAAERETQEECGLSKNDLDYYEKFEKKLTYDVDGEPKDVHYYLARIRNANQPVKLSDEHQNFKWSNLQDACQLVEHNDMQSTLREAEKFIINQQKDHL